MNNIFISIICAFFSILMYRYYLSWKAKKKKERKTDSLHPNDYNLAVQKLGLVILLAIVSIIFFFKSI